MPVDAQAIAPRRDAVDDEVPIGAGGRCDRDRVAAPPLASPPRPEPLPARVASALSGAPFSSSAVTSAPVTGSPAPSTTNPVSFVPPASCAGNDAAPRARGPPQLARPS